MTNTVEKAGNRTLTDVIESSGVSAGKKGFHEDGDLLRRILGEVEFSNVEGHITVGEVTIAVPAGFWDRIYSAYKGNRLMLIVGEVVEAHEEVRSGKPQIYLGENGKPEGTSVELADVQIRLGDYVYEFGENMEEAMDVKESYNATRGKLHGGRKF